MIHGWKHGNIEARDTRQ